MIKNKVSSSLSESSSTKSEGPEVELTLFPMSNEAPENVTQSSSKQFIQNLKFDEKKSKEVFLNLQPYVNRSYSRDLDLADIFIQQLDNYACPKNNVLSVWNYSLNYLRKEFNPLSVF